MSLKQEILIFKILNIWDFDFWDFNIWDYVIWDFDFWDFNLDPLNQYTYILNAIFMFFYKCSIIFQFIKIYLNI